MAVYVDESRNGSSNFLLLVAGIVIGVLAYDKCQNTTRVSEPKTTLEGQTKGAKQSPADAVVSTDAPIKPSTADGPTLVPSTDHYIVRIQTENAQLRLGDQVVENLHKGDYCRIIGAAEGLFVPVEMRDSQNRGWVYISDTVLYSNYSP